MERTLTGVNVGIVNAKERYFKISKEMEFWCQWNCEYEQYVWVKKNENDELVLI